MQYIAITRTFQKQIKTFKRYLSEKDIVDDIKNFAKN